MNKKGKVKEWKCKCNQCKHIWHYLDSEEKQLKGQQLGNALIGVGMCCNPFGAYFSNKSIEQARERNKFNQCPKCGTGDITKEEVYYEKKV